MNKDIITLTEEEISIFKKILSPFTFKNEFDLVYESHVPNTGIILLAGELKLIKRKKVLGTLPFGSLVGMYNLINNTPLPMGIKISKDSSVLMIEKSQILEAISEKHGLIYQLISSAL